MADRVLIVGIDSMIGGAVANNLGRSGFEVIGTSRRRANPQHLHLDLTDDMGQWRIPDDISFAAVFAGVTALRDCDVDPDGTRLVNVTSALLLIERLVARGIYVMYPSSNLVFSEAAGMLDETAVQTPSTEYGRQKADVERGLAGLMDRVSIVRFTKVLPPRFDLFIRWLRVLESGGEIHPFRDLMFSPITLDFSAAVSAAICRDRHAGIFHVSGAESISYAEAAHHIARKIGAHPHLVQPVSGREVGIDTEHMPRNGTLLAPRLENELGITRPDVWKSIDECLDFSPIAGMADA